MKKKQPNLAAFLFSAYYTSVTTDFYRGIIFVPYILMIIVWQSLKKVIGCDGIMVFPFIILGKKDFSQNKVILNHEYIHIRQAIELLVIPFYIIYLTEFFIRRLSSKSRFEAYRKISFEQEAYNHDDNLQYLKSRSPYSFIKYWKQ